MNFIVIGDSKGKDNGIHEKVLDDIMKESCRLNPQPELIVLCGDNIAGSDKEELMLSQIEKLKGLIKKYHPASRLVPVAGNHEVNNKPIDDRYESIFSRAYSDLSTDGYLESYNKTAYYMDFKDIRLIVLNAFHHGALHKIEGEQLIWFERAASTDIKYKFVFVHSPAYPTGDHLGHCLDLYPVNRDAFWEIVDNCNIDMVFSGHEHNYSRRFISSSFNGHRRGIYQIITGGGGEKPSHKYRSKMDVIVPPVGLYHFVSVTVNSDCIKVVSISSRGKTIDEFIIPD